MNGDSITSKPIKIGVFDSGIGGLSVVAAIKEALPDYEVIFRQDEQNFPYGTKPTGHLMRYVEPILNDMVHEGCSVIVIACNTVTTTMINLLRQLVPVPLIGILPMIEEAAHVSKSGKIAVCATPAVYASTEYKKLKQTHGQGLHIFEIECRDWPFMAAHDIVDDLKVGKRIEEVIGYGVDTIVLAATHFSWIGSKIRYVAAMHKAEVVRPEAATVEWLKAVIADLEFKAQQVI